MGLSFASRPTVRLPTRYDLSRCKTQFDRQKGHRAMMYGTAPTPTETASPRQQVDKLLDAFDFRVCQMPIQLVAMRQHRCYTVHRRFPWPRDVRVHEVETREVLPLGHDSLGILLHANSGLAACLVRISPDKLKTPSGTKRQHARELSPEEISVLWSAERLPCTLHALTS